MRSLIGFLSLMFLLVFAVWWFSPDQELSGATGGKGKRAEKSKSFASEAPEEDVPKSLATPKKVAVGELSLSKSVGAHQGPPVPFRRRATGEPSTQGGEDKSPFERYAKLRLGPGMQIAGKKRKVLAARAVQDEAIASKLGPVAFKDLGYSIVATDNDANFEKMIFDKGAKPVVINAANGRLGIVTGTLIVQVSDPGAADRLAGQENFQILRFDNATNLVYYRVPDGYEIASGVERVSKAQGVLKTELEILEGFKEAR